MLGLSRIEPVDYLVIGHVTKDIIPGGYTLGGTASYAAQTARSIGLRVGVVTSHGADIELPEIPGIQYAVLPSEFSTTFENRQTPSGRIQTLFHTAAPLDLSAVPETWRHTPIVHIAPVAREVDTNLIRVFNNSLIGVTPQGYLRDWDHAGRVYPTEWPEASYVLQYASAAVLSIEDVQGEEEVLEDMLASLRILVVTEGAAGCRLFWNGDLRRFRPPHREEIEPTGAGDIFATSFFIRLSQTRDPWEAARFATLLAANSVTRVGLAGIPSPEEVQSALMEVIKNQP
jgi:sugar/nucleoside kinase (ribokinase family)